MARPIKDTPVLEGEDARRFTKAMENVQPLSAERRMEYRQAYELVKSRATFLML
ncbi:MAG: hypothetical protein LBN95_10120 [Prevotellaceae bacterium]|jgi:hypothetical protein|nr:hypothetical protein [Prevotellaceae bacterium]